MNCLWSTLQLDFRQQQRNGFYYAALFLAAFAGNKVAGLNILKFVNLVMLLPIAAFLVPMPVQLWAGLIPHYWGMKVFVQAAEGEAYWAYALVAALYSPTLIALLLWQFRRSIRA